MSEPKIVMWIIINSVDCTVYEKSLSYTKRGAIENLEERYGITPETAKKSGLIAVMLTSEIADKEACNELIKINNELIMELADMVNQHCQVRPGDSLCPKSVTEPYYDSMALSVNASAMRLLIKLGYMEEIKESYGRRITARFTDKMKDIS